MFLAALFLQLLNVGIGCLLVDPHSDLCTTILAALLDQGYFRDERAYSRLWYLNFSGQGGRYVPFDILRQPYPPHLVARQVWEAWTRAWGGLGDGAAPLMEQMVLAGTLVLIENQLPLTCLERLLTDATFRARLLPRVHDAHVVEFFTRFEATGKRNGMLSESVLRRSFLLTFVPQLRNALGQEKNLLNIRQVLDAGTSVLCDLGGLDEETQRFLGCLLSTGVEQAALSRADVPEYARRPYILILDEWSMFAAKSAPALERMLALVRKYNVSTILAAQTLGQTRSILSALQNARLIAFRTGVEDSAWAAERLAAYDGEKIKYTPRGTPVAVSASEQRDELERILRDLPARQAFTRLAGNTLRLRTLGFPSTHTRSQELARVKTYYAQLLLTLPSRTEQGTRMPGALDAVEEHVPASLVLESSQVGRANQASRNTPARPMQRPLRIVPLSGPRLQQGRK